MNTPLPDDHQPLRDALQRDAARISEPAFDAQLHHDTMRQIRALTAANANSPWFAGWPAMAAAAAVLAVAIGVALFPSRSPLPHASPVATAETSVAPAQASLLAYRVAARNGDAALFATLDRDAAELLPASSPIFRTTLQ